MMPKIKFKKILLNLIIFLIIFFADRISKVYILELAEFGGNVDVYITPYLSLYLIWNKGIAFGLLSFDASSIYNTITFIIIGIVLIISVMIIKSNGFKKYCLISIFAGSLGNLFDRIYYTAVPDFIDIHMGAFHWFIFNVADIFISLGVLCLILAEVFFNKEKKNEIK